MRSGPALLLSAVIFLSASQATAGIFLAGEPVQQNNDGVVAFSKVQLDRSSAITRAGLVRWLQTPQGRRLFRHFSTPEYRIVVIEDFEEPAIGRAPEPSLLTLLAAGDHSKTKTYTLVLNPTPWTMPDRAKPFPNQPSTPADYAAAAWAAEMLHIDLYSRGIMLPHHERRDFQESWLTVAKELGFPSMLHGEEDPSVPQWRRRPIRNDEGDRRYR